VMQRPDLRKPRVVQLYEPDGTGHCKHCGQDVKSGHISADRMLVCKLIVKGGPW
jgi:uncharacterized protein (UPF0212 family)